MPAAQPAIPLQSLPVFRAADFCVSDGANLGDALADASDLVLDDSYTLSPAARRERLAIASADGRGDFVVAKGSEIGTPGAALYLDCVATFMTPDSDTIDAVILVEVAADDDTIAAIYLMPFAEIMPKVDYRLVGVDTASAKARLAEVACVSFTRGTLITLASGAQCPIEELKVGDRVLTRDAGPQMVRWIGQNTLRAVGEFAPIVIASGTLNNSNDLVVSPNHRLFVYQRSDEIGIGRSEVLVKARHLLNGTSVIQQDGGFVDYFQLLFDSHQIIYAEGIAAESLLLDTRTTPALPDGLTAKLAKALDLHKGSDSHGYEVKRAALAGEDTADILRRASSS